jgi:hypothetical protein
MGRPGKKDPLEKMFPCPVGGGGKAKRKRAIRFPFFQSIFHDTKRRFLYGRAGMAEE